MHEVRGNDAVVTTRAAHRSEVAAVQFKYSRESAKSIQVSDLIEILHAFDRSFQQSPVGTLPGKYYLVTNRLLSPDAQALYDRRRTRRVVSDLAPRTHFRNNKPIKAAKQLLKEYGSSSAAGKAWHAVLRKLEIWQDVRFGAWVERLADHAHRLGLLADEWPNAYEKLIGRILV